MLLIVASVAFGPGGAKGVGLGIGIGALATSLRVVHVIEVVERPRDEVG